MGSFPKKYLKITFFTDAPFIVKFRFEKYRNFLTFLLCIQIFEVPLSDSHSTGPQKETHQEPKGGRLVSLPVLSDDTVKNETCEATTTQSHYGPTEDMNELV